MNNEEHERAASPRPWRVVGTQNTLQIYDAEDNLVLAILSRFATPEAPKHDADADLIVDAVNAYDRVTAKEKAVAEEINGLRLENNHIRQTLRKLADMYMDHTV